MNDQTKVQPVLEGRDLSVSFRRGSDVLRAVRDVSISVGTGETVALVGESGSGKSTLALALIRALEPEGGSVSWGGRDVTHLKDRELRPLRRDVQMIQQDPYSSLDPRWRVRDIVLEPLRVQRRLSKREADARVAELLEWVGLPREAAGRLPSQFSGGQRQRVAIARALSVDPAVVVADEPVSALDVSIQAQIVNLLRKIQRERGLSFLLISHDLALVQHMAHSVVVLYLGTVVETGAADSIVARPLHPYTAALLSAAPSLSPQDRTERIVLEGDPPSPMAQMPGCPFAQRCPIARSRCHVERPELVESLPGRQVACFYPGELPGRVNDVALATAE